MPELPEVETIRRGLEDILRDHPIIRRVELKRADIRFPIPAGLPRLFKGQAITGIRRRAKYLLFDTPRAILLSHLGMTGSWRIAQSHDHDEDRHDHVVIELVDGRRLVFRDPRRFGLIDSVAVGKEREHPRLKGLGPEPLDESAFSGADLHAISRGRRVCAKVFIMNQKIVVGVGNIYASEALFRAKIRPQKLAGQMTRSECDRLVDAIRLVLRNSIALGGSSIRDYRQAGGESGGFQETFMVYDRGGRPCGTCGAVIRSEAIGGRSTYWCSVCQRG